MAVSISKSASQVLKVDNKDKCQLTPFCCFIIKFDRIQCVWIKCFYIVELNVFIVDLKDSTVESNFSIGDFE